MKKRLLILFIILSLILISFALGCNNQATTISPKQDANIKVKRFTNESAAPGLPKKAVDEARLEVQEVVKKYFETAFLDLSLAKSSQYTNKVLTFYAANAQNSAFKDFRLLSLGQDAPKINLVTNNKLELPLVSLNFNKKKKANIGVVQFDFKGNYKAELQPVTVKTFGWFALQKEASGWKIFDFWVQQSVE